MNDLLVDVDHHVLSITLNRPGRRNAFTMDMLDQWATALRGAQADDNVRVVLLRGAGKHFCSGVDLDEYDQKRSSPLDDKRLLTNRVHQVAHAMELLDKPVVAAIAGVAYGAGMDMALMADIRIAASSMKMSEAYVRVGLLPGDGGCYLLPRLVGMPRALELLWTGDVVDAEQALAWGLVNRTCPDEELESEARSLAAALASRPPIAVQMIKRAAYQSATTDFRTALDLISSHQAVVQATDDSREALSAFRERRIPVFRGR